jgi:hypothetical protein
VVGSLYNGTDKPNLGSGLFDNGKVKRRGFVSRKGHKFIFFDDDNKSGVAIISSDGNFKISFNETSKEIHIKSSEKVTVESGKDMTLKSGADLNIQASRGITMKADGALSLQSSQGATLDGGPKLDVKASGQISVDGMFSVNSGALMVTK